MQNKLFIIDGNSLMFRAYYAMNAPMCNSEGFPTGAIYGFLSMLIKLTERQPTHLAVAFDLPKPTFRHIKYDAYKQGRRPTPDDLIVQMPVLQRILSEMGIKVLTQEGYEADDILGTVSKMGESHDASVLLVTGDRDALQLIDKNIHVLLTRRGITDTEEMTEASLNEKYGLTPPRMIDLKALMGDSSDNIPGIPGIGEKTALKLLTDFGSLDNILASKESIPGKLGEKIISGEASALLSRELGTINREVPLSVSWEDLYFDTSLLSGALESLKKLELKSIISRIPSCVQKEKEITLVSKPKREEVSSLEQVEKIISAQDDFAAAAVSFYNGFSFAFDSTVSYFLNVQGDLFSDIIEPEKILELLVKTKRDIISFDIKQVRHVIPSCYQDYFHIGYDAGIADYLLSSNKPADSPEALSEKYIGISSGDAAVLFPLRVVLEKMIREKGLDSLYYDMELKLSVVLFSMERDGFLLDRSVLSSLRNEFTERQSALEKNIYELAGEKFNINSTKQLGTVLFDPDKLGLPSGKKTKSGYSTDSDTLEWLSDRHPIIPLIMDYRFTSKLNSTFLEGLMNAMDQEGRIHSHFNQCVTATGRISSNNPNLQNIPTRTEEGRKIRRAFVASPGNILVGADYSQIELRLLAHLSGDENLIEAFHSGIDIHTKTASEVFHVPIDHVTKEQRSAAKAVNFGIIYGISDFGLSNNLKVPIKEAGNYIKQYLDRYPKVQSYMKSCVESAKEKGYAETLFGRIRQIPELSSGNYNTRSFGERVAMNMPIQGSAADIIKIAMVRVFETLRDKGLRSRLILQIHDELIVDTVLEEQDIVTDLVRECMEQAVSLKVPLRADISAAYNWADAK